MDNTNKQLLNYLRTRPELYAPSTNPFWDDEYISQNMLYAHIDPDIDSASRKHSFIVNSVDWIADFCGGGKDKKLLDLGCGPGIYADLLTDKGFKVTGVDFSKRSVNYASEKAKSNGKDITYIYKNYLDIDYENEFDAVILVYCDYGVLSPSDREKLLKKIHRALKSGGILIFDVWNTPFLESYNEVTETYYNEGGFWSPESNMVILRSILYKEHLNTLDQYIVMTENDLRCYNIWNQVFTEDVLSEEVRNAGFSGIKFFDDISGADFTGKKDTLCITSVK